MNRPLAVAMRTSPMRKAKALGSDTPGGAKNGEGPHHSDDSSEQTNHRRYHAHNREVTVLCPEHRASRKPCSINAFSYGIFFRVQCAREQSL
mgnify:CR=1 FL=1